MARNMYAIHSVTLLLLLLLLIVAPRYSCAYLILVMPRKTCENCHYHLHIMITGIRLLITIISLDLPGNLAVLMKLFRVWAVRSLAVL